ncbi:hypothetical protein ACWDUL_08735 [Nocardia niigatensis]
MFSQPTRYVRIGLSDDLKPIVPPGDDPAAASAIANFALAQQTVFDTRLRRFLNGRFDAAPMAASSAWGLSGVTNGGVLEWVRQWPTEAVDGDADVDIAQLDAIAAAELVNGWPSASGLAIPKGDDPEAVREITEYVFRSIRELRAEIDIFGNAHFFAAPASAIHAWDLSAGYLQILIAWAVNWPR